jgi:hypothetical protein
VEKEAEMAHKIHVLGNSVEAFRKRLKNVEDVDGASDCSKTIQNLQVRLTSLAQQPPPTNPFAQQPPTVSHVPVQPTASPATDADEEEGEDQILARQVQLADLAAAKQAAK